MDRTRRSRRAIAGFLEEIPVLLVVVISFLLLFSAISVALSALSSRESSTTFATQASSLVEGLLGYRNLTYQGTYGVFEASRVMNLTESNISWEFHPSYGFQVNITDVSDYPLHYDRVVGNGPVPTITSSLHQGIYVAQEPVSIRVSDVEVHNAIVEVTIWE